MKLNNRRRRGSLYKFINKKRSFNWVIFIFLIWIYSLVICVKGKNKRLPYFLNMRTMRMILFHRDSCSTGWSRLLLLCSLRVLSGHLWVPTQYMNKMNILSSEMIPFSHLIKKMISMHSIQLRIQPITNQPSIRANHISVPWLTCKIELKYWKKRIMDSRALSRCWGRKKIGI